MDEKSCYVHILSLTAPWKIKSFNLNENGHSVTVTAKISENFQLTSQTCKRSCSVHIHLHCEWHHLDNGQFITLVEADVPLLKTEYGVPCLPT